MKQRHALEAENGSLPDKEEGNVAGRGSVGGAAESSDGGGLARRGDHDRQVVIDAEGRAEELAAALDDDGGAGRGAEDGDIKGGDVKGAGEVGSVEPEKKKEEKGQRSYQPYQKCW